jgi:hypothetical protein
MKFALTLCFFAFFSTSLKAQYQDQALDQALESRFSTIRSKSPVTYIETDGRLCDLEAKLWVEGTSYDSDRSMAYNCSVCLYADDNLFWDYESIECELSAY